MLVVFFPVAIVLAWAFELTPDGIKTTKHAREEQCGLTVSRKQERKRNWMTIGFAAAQRLLNRQSSPNRLLENQHEAWDPACFE